MQRQALADIGQRHLVARVMVAVLAIGIAQHHVHFVAHMVDVDADHAGFDATARCRDRPRSRAAAAAPAAGSARPPACCRYASRLAAASPRRSCSRLRYWRHSSTSRASGARSRLSAISTRNRSAMSSSAASARRGSCGSATSTALMLLNRKCGRMRACSACSRPRSRPATARGCADRNSTDQRSAVATA